MHDDFPRVSKKHGECNGAREDRAVYLALSILLKPSPARFFETHGGPKSILHCLRGLCSLSPRFFETRGSALRGSALDIARV